VKVKTHILRSVTFFLRQCRKIWWSQRGYKWLHNMTHTRCMLDKQAHTHAREHSNTYCFSTATVVTWTCLNDTWYAHCLSCYGRGRKMTVSYKSFVEFHFGPNSLPARRDVQLRLLLNTFLFTATEDSDGNISSGSCNLQTGIQSVLTLWRYALRNLAHKTRILSAWLVIRTRTESSEILRKTTKKEKQFPGII
jgi:hypothetical protein